MNAKLVLMVVLATLGTEVRAHANLLGNESVSTASALANSASWLPDASTGSYFVQLNGITAPSSAGSVDAIDGSIAQSLNVSQELSQPLISAISGEATDVAQGPAPFSAAGYQAAVEQSASGATTKTLMATESSPFTPAVAGLANPMFNATGGVSLESMPVEVVPEFSHWAVFAGFALLVVGFRRGRALLGAIRA